MPGVSLDVTGMGPVLEGGGHVVELSFALRGMGGKLGVLVEAVVVL